MRDDIIRTRFAPSPTGFMHVGNLRTALYAFLIAKSSKNGKFILRIEDTDKNRKIEGAIDLIFRTLKKAGLQHDEGPDVGGDFGPYVQSERLDKYIEFAKYLISKDKAYYCFCEDQQNFENRDHGNSFKKYNKKCRGLTKEEVKKNLSSGAKYAIRQKMPLSGSTSFTDAVFGMIITPNSELEDQILIKRDGYPTYNFANVIDDHEMMITHVVRGSEYLTSTPKYNLLYEAFDWQTPIYVHTGLIMGENEDGSVSKLSKRHGATSFEDLENLGYLPEVIVNYIALLGWYPKNNQEIFSLEELVETFSINNMNKSPSIFDYGKLDWFNSEYLKLKSDEDFIKICAPYINKAVPKDFAFFKKNNKDLDENSKILLSILRTRVVTLSQIPGMLMFLKILPQYDVSFFENKKSKSSIETSLKILEIVISDFSKILIWSLEEIKETMLSLAKKLEVKNGTVMWPIRISISGTIVTPGGAPEILKLLGKDEAIARMEFGIKKIKEYLNQLYNS
ncbi:MAG: glutamate--tRNA ligase [Oscillospiraceae bacterium]|jgi:glutamyl-tRNA synthetase|nr:glutamate--tRNA ligase [Oscillospiraceae bacterium]